MFTPTVIAASLSKNSGRHPHQCFESFPIAYGSLDEAIEAIKAFFFDNIAEGLRLDENSVVFRSYTRTEDDGSTHSLVEVARAGPSQDMGFIALFKAVAGRCGFSDPSPAASGQDAAVVQDDDIAGEG